MTTHDDSAAASLPERPRLRRVESFPIRQSGGEVMFALRDPEGFSGSVALPHQAAVLAALMDGSRTMAEMQTDFARQFGQAVDLADVEQVVRELDQRYFLDTDRFRARWRAEVEGFLNSRVRLPAHAGSAYAADPQELRRQIDALFTDKNGPGLPAESAAPDVVSESATGRLCGVVSPHIDFRRAGPSLAWAYRKIADESDADLFLIFGTSHNPMRNLFALTKKDFATPLGKVETDRQFVARLAARASAGDKDINLYADELAHRQEHSIEFQTVMLQYLLGDKRPFKIVPVLVGSFHEFVRGQVSPSTSPQVSNFIAALRHVVGEHPGRVCAISSADLAHIGQRFGDREFLAPARLQEQAERDRQLLAAACSPDAGDFFQRIAGHQDRDRICGLSPTYTMLETTRPQRGELLRYDQAVELDGTSCVSFASAAFYC
jgi:AmmeMemoRadiSam system protein B